MKLSPCSKLAGESGFEPGLTESESVWQKSVGAEFTLEFQGHGLDTDQNMERSASFGQSQLFPTFSAHVQRAPRAPRDKNATNATSPRSGLSQFRRWRRTFLLWTKNHCSGKILWQPPSHPEELGASIKSLDVGYAPSCRTSRQGVPSRKSGRSRGVKQMALHSLIPALLVKAINHVHFAVER